ncbi:MAG: S8 family serine peptidase, partial [Chloroflexota bacterium]
FSVNYPHNPSILPIWDRIPTDQTVTGRGVTMAFVDSGFAPHPDIAPRIKRYVDAASRHILEYGDISATDVFSWHGQMTSFIAAGSGATSGGRYRGRASDDQLVLVRITSKQNTLREHDIQRGLDWLCHRHEKLGIRVVNVSVGGDAPSSDPDHPLHRAISRLIEDGVVVTIASGNSGQRGLVPPATTPGAVVVGGYDDQNTMNRDEWFPYNSNWGEDINGKPKPDLIAPAAWLPSPILAGSDMERDAAWLAPLLYQDDVGKLMDDIINQGYEEMDFPGVADQLPMYRIHRLIQERIHKHKLIDQHHQHVDGTSVAAPIVAAVAAQMLEANPDLAPHDVRRILKETAVPLMSMPLEQQGAGIVNPLAAVELAREMR